MLLYHILLIGPRQQEDQKMATTYGYARVSSKDQNEDRQLIALQQAGVARELIYVDKKSGKDFNRPAWRRLRRKLKCGDLLVVKSLDRFGRSYDDMISEWRHMTKDKGIHIKVLDMPLLDTTAAQGLLAVFLSDLVLQILSFVAQTERDHIKERQREGIAAAKARGVHFGRPKLERPACLGELIDRVSNGSATATWAARQIGVSRTTFRRWRSAFVNS